MKLCVVILAALCVTLTTSVLLTGEYSKGSWWTGGPTYLIFQVGGVEIHEPYDNIVRLVTQVTFGSEIVENLNMDHNYLKYLPGRISSFFPNIKALVVRNAHVKYLKNADFAGLTLLNHLDLHGNEIEHLPADLFVGNTRGLINVSFKYNKLTNIDSNFFDSLPAIKNLYFEGNPCIDMQTHAITHPFKAMVQSNCNGPIMPHVTTGPAPTYEENKTLYEANVDLKKTTENLKYELKLKIDRIHELERTQNVPGQCSENTSQLTKDLTKANHTLELNVLKLQLKDYKIDELKRTTNTLEADLSKKDSDISKLNKELIDAREALKACNVNKF